MLNSISMVGRLTRDPELRQTKSGDPVGNFTIACDDRPINGEKQVVFITCSIFGKGAETLVKFFKKGNLIGVTGRLTQRKYKNQANVEITATEIRVNQIEFVESKGEQAQSEATTEVKAPQGKNLEEVEIDDESLPF